MKLLIGLGNPGAEYKETRHNTGFLFADWLGERLTGRKPEFAEEKKFEALVWKVEMTGGTNREEWLLVKPQTFMNSSGKTVSKLLAFYKLKPSDSLIVVHDDLDMPVGDFKIQFGKGPHVHNGLNSIVSSLHTPQFWRIRIGIAGQHYQEVRQSGEGMAENYILKPFTREEIGQLNDIFPQLWDKLVKNQSLYGFMAQLTKNHSC